MLLFPPNNASEAHLSAIFAACYPAFVDMRQFVQFMMVSIRNPCLIPA
jgi:hypothetical protein